MPIAGCGTPVKAAIPNTTRNITTKVIMGSLYTSTPVTGYNANPPPDDGTQVATNEITWVGIKTKIGDPLNTFAGAIDTDLITAFGKTLDGATVATTAVNYPMSAADQGRLIKATAGGVVITTPDATSVGAPFVFAINNQSNAAITLSGFGGTQTIDGSTSQAINPGQGCICKTDGANWFSFGLAANQAGFSPQGYLTLASSTTEPILNANVTASTNVYYTPFVGPVVPIYNGTAFANFSISQLTLALNNPAHAASTIYDVFIFLNAGTVTIGTGPAWSNSGAGTGARGTGAGTTEITRINGLWVNANSMTARNGSTTYTVAANQGTYVGSIFIDGTAGQVSCHVTFGSSRKWGVWNAYNRNLIALQAGSATSSWTYDTAVTRAADNDTTNSLTVFTGLAEQRVDLRNSVKTDISGATDNASIGIGWNSTSSSSATATIAISTTNTLNVTQVAHLVEAPFLGINVATQLESGGGGGATVTFHTGTLTALWMG